jgi:ABC-type antimicrobial peptide transport system permease subunit
MKMNVTWLCEDIERDSYTATHAQLESQSSLPRYLEDVQRMPILPQSHLPNITNKLVQLCQVIY